MNHRSWALRSLLLLMVAASCNATHAATAAQASTGSIAVSLHACPAGMRPLDLDTAACDPDPDVAALRIFVIGSGETRRDLADATEDDATFTWDELPFGEYILQAADFASGYDRYLIPGRDGLNMAPDLGYTASPNEGYLLPLDADTSRYALDVFVFRVIEATGSARLGVRLWQCPPGVTAALDMRDRGCVALDTPPTGFALEITGQGVETPLQLDQATASGDGIVGWDDVPRGEYLLTARPPEGTSGYAVRSYAPDTRVHRLSDHSGYALVLWPVRGTPTPATGEAVLDVYLLT